jgi:hypothetical protein
MAGHDIETLIVDTTEVDDVPYSSSQRTCTPSQKARQNQYQGESASTTEPKTSKRAPRTTNRGRTEDRNTWTDVTGWQKVLEVVGTTNEEIRKLMQIVIQQQEVIKGLEKHLEETQQEVRDVKTQLDEIKTSGVAIASTEASPQGSYTDVARTPPTSQPSNVHTLSSINTIPLSFTDTLFCTIDTSRIEDRERDKMTVGTIRAMIEQAICTIKDRENWRYCAVTVDPKRENWIKIAC